MPESLQPATAAHEAEPEPAASLLALLVAQETPPSPPWRRRLRHLLLTVLVLSLMAISGLAAYQLAQRMGLAEVRATGMHRLDLYAASLQREIGKYAFLPGVLELESDVQSLLAPDSDEAARASYAARVNSYLEQLNEQAGTLAAYVIDTQGRVVAASNWRRSDGYLGEDLSFRPYFLDAMRNGSGRVFGIGTTRGEPGYYLASALSDSQQTLGVAVIKVSLDQLEQSWATVEAPVLVSDEHGVAILSSVSDWKFSTLRPLDAAERTALEQSQQYSRRALQPLGLQIVRELGNGARLVRLAHNGQEMASTFPVSGQFLAQSRMLPGTPWTLTVLSHLEQVEQVAQSRALAAAIAAAFLSLLALMLNERRRHLRDRLAAREALQAAHDALERKVARRTADLSAANQQLQDEVAERIRTEATLRAAQDELVQAGKLAVIGQLSTGIAHELNQPLTALRTLSGNSLKFLDRGDTATTRVNLERMSQLADRMGHITGQLRNFARKSRGERQRVPLGQALDNALSVLEARVQRGGVQLRFEMAMPEPVAWCDGNRIEQVLVNLIHNALDAMEGMEHPCLELHCRTQGHQVLLCVRDHGPGLSDVVQAHLFEPFFTTKDPGVGLGLGLPLSAGIVRDCGGSLTGANHPQGGAIFTLVLPLAPATPATPDNERHE